MWGGRVPLAIQRPGNKPSSSSTVSLLHSTVAVCCGMLRYVAVCCGMLRYVAVCCSMAMYGAVCQMSNQ